MIRLEDYMRTSDGELRPGNILITPTGHASISLYPVEVLCGSCRLYKLDDVRFDPPESLAEMIP